MILLQPSAFSVQTFSYVVVCNAYKFLYFVARHRAIFPSIDSHRFEFTTRTWQQYYTLVYFMAVCRWCIANNAHSKEKNRLCMLKSGAFRTPYKFCPGAFIILLRLVFPLDSICLCVSSFELSNEFHIHSRNLHQMKWWAHTEASLSTNARKIWSNFDSSNTFPLARKPSAYFFQINILISIISLHFTA